MEHNLDLEEKKIMCETVKKILYGIEFDELPPVKILQAIEEEYEVVLEFKNHFRYLVPQVYGWEFMDEFMYHGQPFPREHGEPKESPENIEQRCEYLRPKETGMTYYEFCHCLAGAYYRCRYKMTGEDIRPNDHRLEKATWLCEKLFYSFKWMLEEIEGEEEFLKDKANQIAILDKLNFQLRKFLGADAEQIMYYCILASEFVDNIINDKLMKCKDTLSGDDSVLTNFWEEYCVQVQQEHSFYWQSYENQLYLWIKEEFVKLPMWKRNAIWLQLKDNEIRDYYDLEYDSDESRDDVILFYEDDAKNVDVENKVYYDLDEVIDLITHKITDEAADFTNKAIERYLYGGCDSDDDD